MRTPVISRGLNRNLIGILVAAAAVAAVAAGVAFPIPTHDTAMRYAVMAEKFAVGEWREAFHPRFGVLFPLLAGSFHFVTGCGGLSACSAVSMLAWFLSVVPIYHISKYVFGRHVARISVILYLLCPLPLLWGLQGLREPYRLLGVVLTVEGLLGQLEEKRSSFPSLCAGLAVLFLLRADTIVLACVLLFLYAIMNRFGGRTWIVAGMSAGLLQIPCFLVWSWTGWWLPASQYIGVVQKFVG